MRVIPLRVPRLHPSVELNAGALRGTGLPHQAFGARMTCSRHVFGSATPTRFLVAGAASVIHFLEWQEGRSIPLRQLRPSTVTASAYWSPDIDRSLTTLASRAWRRRRHQSLAAPSTLAVCGLGVVWRSRQAGLWLNYALRCISASKAQRLAQPCGLARVACFVPEKRAGMARRGLRGRPSTRTPLAERAGFGSKVVLASR